MMLIHYVIQSFKTDTKIISHGCDTYHYTDSITVIEQEFMLDAENFKKVIKLLKN